MRLLACPLATDPDRHAGFEPSWITLWIKTQAQCVAIVIANCPFGLPGCERPERRQLGNERGRGLGPPCLYDVDLRSHREAMQHIFAGVEREPLLAGRLRARDILPKN